MQLGEINQRWILGGCTLVLTIATFFGGTIISSQQSQIDNNSQKIWQLSSTAVTENKLNTQIQQVTDYINVRVQSLESQQREILRQLTISIEDNKEAQQQTRESLESIRQSLAEKADREF